MVKMGSSDVRTFELSSENCDEIAQLVESFCAGAKIERKDAIRCRLSVEECLLRWLDRNYSGSTVSLRMGCRFQSPVIRLETEGPECNPYLIEEENTGEFYGSILVNIGLQPSFSYVNGRNRLLFRLKRKAPGQIVRLGTAIAGAVIIGFLGLLLPVTIRESVREGLIVPVYQTFFRILGCVAGPLVFFSAAWGIYGIGDTAALGRVGKKLILRFICGVFLGGCWAMLCFPLLGPSLSGGTQQGNQLSSILSLFLNIFPPNIVEPFSSGNTLQIVFMSFVTGVALLQLDQRTSGIASLMEQFYSLVQFLMGGISSQIPTVIFLIVVNLIWSGTITAVSAAWKLVLASAAMMTTAAGFLLLRTAWRWKIPPALLLKKVAPAFLVTFSTASSTAAFGTCQETCQKQFGIDSALSGFGIPTGIMLSRSNLAIFYLLAIFFFAERYGVSASPVWLVTALFSAALMGIAAPPVPGGGAAVFAMLFSQVGIPLEAIAIALSVDIVMDFMMSAFNVMGMLLTMVNVAGELDMMDLRKLRAE